MQSAYIVNALRTPIGNFQGSLSTIRADDLAAHAIRELAARHPEIPAAAYDDVLFGCANQAGEDNRNVARMALLLAGLPASVPGETVNRLCASGMAAAIHAARAVQTGDGHLFIAGGVEHMTRGPWVISKASQAFGRDAEMHDSSFGWRFVNPRMEQRHGVDSMGRTAENLAAEFNISREDQDRFALFSQLKAAKAQQSGRLALEITPVPVQRPKADPLPFTADEFLKPGSSLEGLARLKPAFLKAELGGSVTAGNSSGLNDGAAALLIASDEALEEYQLQPLARIAASAVAGVEPRVMGYGPVPATEKALRKAGLSLHDMDIIELNEAFAAQALACTRAWGIPDDDPRLNPNGGAIALGHPLGMSGARLLQTAALELQLRQKRFALVTMCIGVGQGFATILERT